MSGHSKWHKIKNQKAVNDPKKGKIFTIHAKAIALAARQGGPDPDMNAALRKAIDDAKSDNVPNENIQRAINKGAGIGKGANLETFTLEGYGPGGVALLIYVQTDNRNRTVGEVRHILSKHGGSLGEPGSAKYVFGNDPEKPSFRTPLDEATRKTFDAMLALLNENDDIEKVVHNLQE